MTRVTTADDLFPEKQFIRLTEGAQVNTMKLPFSFILSALSPLAPPIQFTLFCSALSSFLSSSLGAEISKLLHMTCC